MQIPNIGRLVTLGKTVIMVHRPEILLGTSVAATLGSVVLAAKGGYDSGRAVLLAEIAKDQADPSVQHTLTLQEKAVLTWKNYVPAAGAALAAVGSTVGLHLVHIKDKKQLIVTGLAAIEETRESAQTYVNDIKKSVEENATPKTRDKIIEDVNLKTADRNGGKIKVISDGLLEEQYLVRDARRGNHDIFSNQRMIEEALIEVGHQMNGDDNRSCDLNTFYHNAGFGPVPDGDEIGWSGEPPRVTWTTDVRDDGRPVCVFHFDTEPTKGYTDTHRPGA